MEEPVNLKGPSADTAADPRPQCAVCGTHDNLRLCQCHGAYHCSQEHQALHFETRHERSCREAAMLRAYSEEYLRVSRRWRAPEPNHAYAWTEAAYPRTLSFWSEQLQDMETATAARKALEVIGMIRRWNDRDAGCNWRDLAILEARLGNLPRSWALTVAGIFTDTTRIDNLGVGAFNEPEPGTEVVSVIQNPAIMFGHHFEGHPDLLRWMCILLFLKVKVFIGLEEGERVLATAMDAIVQSHPAVHQDILMGIRRHACGNLATFDPMIRRMIGNGESMQPEIDFIRTQIIQLCRAIYRTNRHFWAVFLAGHGPSVSIYTHGMDEWVDDASDRIHEAWYVLRNQVVIFTESPEVKDWVRDNFIFREVSMVHLDNALTRVILA